MSSSAAATITDEIAKLSTNDSRCPALITGDLPVELQLGIYAHLSTTDIGNLALTCSGPQAVISNNSSQLTEAVVVRETARLQRDVDYLNFTNVKLMDAWRRYIHIFGIRRSFNWEPLAQSFLNAYHLANPGFPGSQHDMNLVLLTALAFSDWLQYEYGQAPITPMCERFTRGWELALHIACGHTGEYRPGAYVPMIRLWRMYWPSFDMVAKCPNMIVDIFDNVRSETLQDLNWLPLEDIRYAWNTEWDKPTTIPQDVMLLPHRYRTQLQRYGLVDDGNAGLCPLLGVQSDRAKKLLGGKVEEGDSRGLQFAALVEEAKVFWCEG